MQYQSFKDSIIFVVRELHSLYVYVYIFSSDPIE